MVSRFECEVRYRIRDVDQYAAKLSELQAAVVYDYAFTDHYHVPDVHVPWNLRRRTLRLRAWTEPRVACQILFSEVERVTVQGLTFKRSILEEGKLCLYEGTFEACERVLASLGFEAWFALTKRDCTFYEVAAHQFKTVREFIPGVGWTGELEVEGDDPVDAGRHLTRQIRLLGLRDEDVTSDPIGAIYAETMGFI
jgi:adenylate cyclase class IV